MAQRVLRASPDLAELDRWLERSRAERLMLVTGRPLDRFRAARHLLEAGERLGVRVVPFSDFQPNPTYESVAAGVRLFHSEGCDALAAVGGGSAMDVAKCVKLFSTLPPDDGTEEGCWLRQRPDGNDIPFLAVPTTAGTGSEATRFAVIYRLGEKQSVAHDSILPPDVLMDPAPLQRLPLYQKKATMLDALSHAVESWWSVRSTDESRAYAAEAVRGVLEHMDGYLANRPEDNEAMLWAAYTAGRAINVTQTTAGHAMCYKLTTLYGLAHGHAAALVNTRLLPWMLAHTDRCADSRGEAFLKQTFADLARAMGCADAAEAAGKLRALYDGMGFDKPSPAAADFGLLARSVNPVRLQNNPVRLTEEDILGMYHDMLD